MSPLEVIWSAAAQRDLRRLDRQVAERVRAAVQRYAATGQGNVKQLQGTTARYRLRVGDWRVRFTLVFETQQMIVERVLPRGRAYRD